MTNATPPELRQVLTALAMNRQPGWHFAGNFLDVSFDELGADGVRLSIVPGPHCTDGDGQANMGAVGLLADICMSAAMRRHTDFAMRMATVSMSLQFSGARRVGRLRAVGGFDGFVQNAGRKQGLCHARVFGDDALLCTVAGTFLAIGAHEGLAPMPTRRQGSDESIAPLAVQALTEDERDIYARARKALEPGQGSFIERFWGFMPQRRDQGATCRLENGLHVGNRVGHTQGGLTVALAAATANAALGTQWQLVGLSSWYVRPGTGPALHAQATVTHQGSFTAVVDVSITDDSGAPVLKAVANHARSN